MSFLRAIFRWKTDIEKELAETYVPMLMVMGGVSEKKAKREFLQLIKIAKKESKKEGTINMPLGFGDHLLENELTDPKIKTMLAKKRKEGVTDDDIRWWWNLHDLERRIMIQIDNIFILGTFSELCEEGFESDIAAKSVRKAYPIYGNPEDTSNTSGDDRPLCRELKNRVNIYTSNRSEKDQNALKSQLENFSSFNAFIRHELICKNL